MNYRLASLRWAYRSGGDGMAIECMFSRHDDLDGAISYARSQVGNGRGLVVDEKNKVYATFDASGLRVLDPPQTDSPDVYPSAINLDLVVPWETLKKLK